jgi:hypothetical protein
MTMPKPTISMKTVKSKIGSGDKSLLPDLCKRLDFMGLAYYREVDSLLARNRWTRI